MAGKTTLTNPEIEVLVAALAAGTAWAGAKALLPGHDGAFLDTQEAAVTALGRHRADEFRTGGDRFITALKVILAPVVTSVTPATTTADTVSRTPVRIDGHGFFDETGITFDGVAAEAVEFVNEKTIRCLAPPHAAGAIDVAVTNPPSQATTAAGALTHAKVTPTFASIKPATGPAAGGAVVQIKGTNFLVGATVDFGVTRATGIVVLSPTLIQCKAPAHAAGAVNVTVTNANAETAAGAGAFTYA